MENYICCYCGKECKNKMSKIKHEHFCKLNPRHEEIMEHHRCTTLLASKSAEAKRMAAQTRRKNIQADENERYEEFVFKCKKCGNEFTRVIKVRNFLNNYKLPQFCSHKCANSHVMTEKTKRKISETLLNKNPIEQKCPKCGKMFMTKSTSGKAFCDECSHKPIITHKKSNSINQTNVVLHRVKKTSYHESKCVFCGKPILVNTIIDIPCPDCAVEHNEHVFRVYDIETKKVILPSIVRRRLSESAKRLVKNGTHVGWKTRPIASYPEKFWMKVLKNNNIDYEFNKPISKMSLGLKNTSACYFLDFCIFNNIDLEIDGKQHKYNDRKESDKIRDKLLKKNGFTIYRIEWNEINTVEGKKIMENKINDFISWLNNFKTRTATQNGYANPRVGGSNPSATPNIGDV